MLGFASDGRQRYEAFCAVEILHADRCMKFIYQNLGAFQVSTFRCFQMCRHRCIDIICGRVLGASQFLVTKRSDRGRRRSAMQKSRIRSEHSTVLGSGTPRCQHTSFPTEKSYQRKLVALTVWASEETKRLKKEVTLRHPAPAEYRSDEDLPSLF